MSSSTGVGALDEAGGNRKEASQSLHHQGNHDEHENATVDKKTNADLKTEDDNDDDDDDWPLFSSFLVITNIQKRANIRHLLSTAVAFGCHQVFVVGQERFQFQLMDNEDPEKDDTAKNLNKDIPTLVQTHMRKWQRKNKKQYVQRFANWKECVAHLAQQRIRLVGVEIHPEALSLQDLLRTTTATMTATTKASDSNDNDGQHHVQPQQPQAASCYQFRGTAFLMGNEGQGIHPKHQQSCNAFVRIPQYGVGTASLNVYTAASIVLQRYYQWQQAQQKQEPTRKQQQSRRAAGHPKSKPALVSGAPHASSLILLCCMVAVFSPLVHAEKAYPMGCSHQPSSFYDYERYPFPPKVNRIGGESTNRQRSSSSSTLSTTSTAINGNEDDNGPDEQGSYKFPPIHTLDDFLIVKRLGTGKFSDVFEAVSVSSEENQLGQPPKLSSMLSSLSTSGPARLSSILTRPRPFFFQQQEQGPASGLDDSRQDTSATTKTKQQPVVLKCLKAVSERKIRREVLVLQHASQLPNLARILGVVLPSSDNSDDSNNNDGNNLLKSSLPQMPTLVLEHAGKDALWLCHPHPQQRNILTSGNYKNNKGVKSLNNGGAQDEVSGEDLLSPFEIRFYLCHLLVALDYLHACGIMHRDVKPRNVLIRRRLHGQQQQQQQQQYQNGDGRSNNNSPSTETTKWLMLIDLGLADFYLPNQRYNVRVASRHYKSPELLVHYEWYDYAVDLWGVGCILAGLLFRREPFFRGRDNLDQLGKIIKCLGTSDLIQYAVKYNMQLSSEVQDILQQYHSRGAIHRQPWTNFLPSETTQPSTISLFQSQAMDLLDKLLVYDHEERWNARQAMQHPFFDSVRSQVLHQVQQQSSLMEGHVEFS